MFNNEYDSNLLDMTQPLLTQISKLNKKTYLQWVHTPYVVPYEKFGMKQARIFKSNFMERFSYTSWYVIPIFWIPIALYFWSFYLKSIYDLYNFVSFIKCATLFQTGLALWSLIEYSVHRFAFHIDEKLPDYNWVLKLHFLLHGIHHKVPNDPYRLVMPPALMSLLTYIGYNFFKKIILFWLPHEMFSAILGSVILGYIMYDMMHYSEHHFKSSDKSYFGKMRRYHMKHHFMSKGYTKGFGISTKFWDYIFDTLLVVD
jgi:4-hydroxysphinganine ceramide fatty acyl 2-hydroxylase